MKITRTVYFCVYTKNNDALPLYSVPFETEDAARGAAKKLSQHGYWGTIEQQRQAKQDYENDYGWLPDWEGTNNKAVSILDYF
jgi:hypothetical protein